MSKLRNYAFVAIVLAAVFGLTASADAGLANSIAGAAPTGSVVQTVNSKTNATPVSETGTPPASKTSTDAVISVSGASDTVAARSEVVTKPGARVSHSPVFGGGTAQPHASIPPGVANIGKTRIPDEGKSDSVEYDPGKNTHTTINRWGDATSQFIFDLDLTELPNVLNAGNRTQLQSVLMSSGNSNWQLTAWISDVAANVNIINGALTGVDYFAVQVLRVFTGKSGGINMLGLIFVTGTVLTILGSLRRFQGRALVTRLISLTIIGALMFSSASALLANGPKSPTDTSYKPPAPTPSWMANTALNAMNRVGELTTTMWLSAVSNKDLFPSNKKGGVPCWAILDNMERYEAGKYNSVASQATDERKRYLHQRKSTRQAVDRMWRVTGLNAWSSAQFGQNNDLKNDAFCYLLESQSTVASINGSKNYVKAFDGQTGDGKNGKNDNYDVNKTYNFGRDKAGKEGKEVKVPPLFAAPSRTAQIAAVTGAAICDKQPDGTFTITPGWEGFNNSENYPEPDVGEGASRAVTGNNKGYGVEGGLSEKNVDKYCKAWEKATKKSDWRSGDLAVFSIHGKDKFVRAASTTKGTPNADRSEVYDFTSNLYGTKTGGATAVTLIYAATSNFAALPIILISLVAVLMQLMFAFFAVNLFVAYLSSVFSGAPWQDRVKPALVQLLTAAIGVLMTSLVMGTMLVFSQILILVMKSFLVSPWDVAWASFTPLISLVGMAWLWRKTFKTPSPFTLKGASAWIKGTALGASSMIGGFVGGRAAGEGGGLRSAADKMKRTLGSSVDGREKDTRKGRMEGTPTDSPTTGKQTSGETKKNTKAKTTTPGGKDVGGKSKGRGSGTGGNSAKTGKQARQQLLDKWNSQRVANDLQRQQTRQWLHNNAPKFVRPLLGERFSDNTAPRMRFMNPQHADIGKKIAATVHPKTIQAYSRQGTAALKASRPGQAMIKAGQATRSQAQRLNQWIKDGRTPGETSRDTLRNVKTVATATAVGGVLGGAVAGAFVAARGAYKSHMNRMSAQEARKNQQE